jgi:hypothetical protein
MAEGTIDSSEFERRIAAFCLGGVGPGLPRKQRDRHIFLKSVALHLGHGREYTESSINTALESWLEAVGEGVRIDHVSLRRYLVDEGYVVRDRAGSTYRVLPSSVWSDLFEPAVDAVDVVRAIHAAAAERTERRKRARSGKPI